MPYHSRIIHSTPEPAESWRDIEKNDECRARYQIPLLPGGMVTVCTKKQPLKQQVQELQKIAKWQKYLKNLGMEHLFCWLKYKIFRGLADCFLQHPSQVLFCAAQRDKNSKGRCAQRTACARVLFVSRAFCSQMLVAYDE